MKSIRSSYSQNNTYVSCPTYWHWSYVQKLSTSETSSALYFGSAVDGASMKLLEGDSSYMAEFHSLWTNARNYSGGGTTPIFDNPDVTFSASDFDADVLHTADHSLMLGWQQQLGLTSLGVDPVKAYTAAVKLQKNPYKSHLVTLQTYINRCCWLSLKRKGEIMIESFKKDFMPKIKKVLSVQESASIVDPNTGDKIFGYIDFVAEIEGYDSPVIFDLKTAGRAYTQEKIDLTEQLTLYYSMVGEKYNTDLVGYVVLAKNINKINISTCQSCGHTKSGRHKTCDALVNKVRCNGAWKEKIILSPEVQVLVQQKTAEHKRSLLLDYGNIMTAMKNNIIYKNYDKCNNWYGKQCAFYDACHKGDTSGLVKK